MLIENNPTNRNCEIVMVLGSSSCPYQQPQTDFPSSSQANNQDTPEGWNGETALITAMLTARSRNMLMSSSLLPVDLFQQSPPQTSDVAAQINEDADIETTNMNSCEFIRAVLAGDKEKAMAQFSQGVVKTLIGWNGETALHMAIMSAKEKHVADVVNAILSRDDMTSDFLNISSPYGTNALHYAVISGNLEIVKKIHQINGDLVNNPNNMNAKPIFMAAIAGHSDVIKFLLNRTTFGIEDHYGSSVLNLCISAGLFDLAADVVKREPRSAITRDRVGENGQTALEVLAQIPSIIIQEHCSTEAIWRKLMRPEECSRKLVNQLLNLIFPLLEQSELYRTSYLRNLLLTAAEKGNYELIVYLLGHYPGLVFSTDDSRRTIFHIAIFHRHEEIFTLIHEIGSLKDLIGTYLDIGDNSMLHLAAKLPHPDNLNRVHGAALQMQKELLWYEEVEKIVPPAYIRRENSDGKTPQDIFNDEHLELMNAGEKWMKRTTQFSMVVSTLIATVVFTTAFTIPGGTNKKGAPNFLMTPFLDMFSVTEIIAMMFSSISIVMHLCILASHYTKKDFSKVLPFWLTIGTTSLFISLISMLLAFCSAFLVFKRHNKQYVVILLGFLAVAPVMFMWFNYRLLADIIKTIRSSNSLSRSCRKLFP